MSHFKAFLGFNNNVDYQDTNFNWVDVVAHERISRIFKDFLLPKLQKLVGVAIEEESLELLNQVKLLLHKAV